MGTTDLSVDDLIDGHLLVLFIDRPVRTARTRARLRRCC